MPIPLSKSETRMARPPSPKADIEKSATAQSRAALRRGRVAVRFEGPALEKGTAGDRGNGTGRRRRGDEVRERILRAALDCYAAFGFEGTSTRAVAERANVTHTLVLYHFQSKDQLWIATVEEALKSYRESMKQTFEVAPTLSAREALSTFIERFVRMSALHPQIHSIMTTTSNQDTPRLQWLIDDFIRPHFTVVRELIRRGQAEGSVREGDPARLYYLIIAGGGTPFTLRTEYKAMTGRDVFSETEILRNIAFLYDIVFV